MHRLSQRLTTAALFTVFALLAGVISVAPLDLTSAYAQTSSDVMAWGRNSQGQLGNGSTSDSSTPVDVADLTGVATIGAGGEHSLAAKTDGTAWAWGQNANGQLGDGTLNDRTTPLQVSGISGITQVDGGLAHSLALHDDGTVWAWGLNQNGQLGDGTTTQRTTPVQVSGLTGVIAIAAGGDHSLALRSDGTVWAWGKNSDGQLGDGSKNRRTSPVQVSNLTGVVAITGGDAHSLAVKADGTVWAWGDNFYGQLGDGTTRDRTTPVQVSGLTGAVAVAGGSFHSLAAKSDGTVWAWGRNAFGQLGDGTTTNRTTPVQIANLTAAIAISAGAHHSLAAASDGTAWAWGLNLYGQLGDGTTTDRSIPVQVSSTTPIDTVAAGAFHSLGQTRQADTTPPSVTLDEPNEGDIVFHVETLSATASDDTAVDRVEFLVDGTLIGTDTDAPYQAEWDSTTTADGDHTVTARAFDAAGNNAEASAVVAVANSFEPAERLRADFEAGALALGDYVRLGLYGVTLPDLLPARYQAPIADLDAEDNGLVIEYLQYWEQLDSDLQADLVAYMDAWMVLDYETARDVAANGVSSSSILESSESSVETQSTTWPECFTYFNGVTACTHLSENFEIFYVPDSLEGSFSDSGVPDVDEIYREGTELINCDPVDFGNCNKVPDYVDRAAAALEYGRVIYGDLGFRLPPSPSRVSIQDARPKVIPTKVRVGLAIGWEPTIVLDNRNSEYSTARHELFHLVQYEYVTLDEIVGRPGVWSWLEATAQWGSHQAQRPSDNDPQERRHYSHLDKFLGRPNWWLFNFEESAFPLANPFRSDRRQYGAFIFAEHLQATLDAGRPADNTSVERTWELIEGGSDAPGAVETVIAEGFGAGAVASRIADFHVDSYVLTNQGTAGFTDPDAPTWRAWISELDRLGRDRPVAEELTMMVGDTWDPTDAERPYVVAGGTVYVEVNLDDGSGGAPLGQLVVDAPAIPEVAYSLIGFSGYPNLCSELSEPLRIDDGPGTAGHAEIALSGTCDRVVLVISHTGLRPGPLGDLEPGFLGNGVQVDWLISLNQLKTELVPVAAFTDVDVVAAGVGALRDVGTGTIELAGVSGLVEQAYLFWHGPTNSIDTSANATIRLNGNTVTGTHVGFGNDNCWGYANSQSYRADVTDLVTGDGSYLLENLIKDGGNVNINGVSLVVIFDDGDPDNDVASYLLFEGNDSNIESIYDPANWDAVLPSISYEGGPAALQFHVGDGQIWEDADLVVNGTVIAPGPQVFDGSSVPGGDGPGGNGSLWDIKTFDIAALLTGGDNTLHVTTGVVSDCLSLVAISAIIGSSGTGPEITSTSATDTPIAPSEPNQGGLTR